MRESLADRLGLESTEDQRHKVKQKWEITTRAELNAKKDKLDEKRLAQWRNDVRERDERRCRVCKVRTEKTLKLTPKRGEAHHIAGRADVAVRYDVRNGLHVCQKCHDLLERAVIVIVALASQMFSVDGSSRAYINGNEPLEFRDTRKADPVAMPEIEREA